MDKITLNDKPEIVVGLISQALNRIEETMEEKDYDTAHFSIIRLHDAVEKVFERMGGSDKIKSYLNEEITKE